MGRRRRNSFNEENGVMMKKRLRILNDRQLKQCFNGATGTLLGITGVIPPNGKPWNMFTVELDEMVPTTGTDGYIEHRIVVLPEECFEEVKC